MKSLQLITKSSNPAPSRRSLRKGFAGIFATALALGLGASSVLAVPPYDPYPALPGSYYPQVNPLGGSPFVPNGMPVVTDPELALLEAAVKLVSPANPNRTLVIPAVAPAVAATAVQYNAAVKAVAQNVATAGSVASAGGTVTVASLAEAVATYQRSGGTVSAALKELALGVIDSGVSVQANLNTAALEAAKGNAGSLTGSKIKGLFDAVSSDATLKLPVGAGLAATSAIGSMLQNALSGAAQSSPATGALTNAGVTAVINDAMQSIILSVGPTLAEKQDLFLTLGKGVGASAAVVGGGDAVGYLDAAAKQLTSNTTYALPTSSNMVSAIAAAVPATDFNHAAIAQGALRTPATNTVAGYNAIKAGLNNFADHLVDAYKGFGGIYSTPTITNQITMLSLDAAAVGAASVVRFPAQSALAEKDVLIAFNNIADSAGVRKIVQTMTGAYQSVATGFARYGIVPVSGSLAAYAKPQDVVYGAIAGGSVATAGAVAFTGFQYAGAGGTLPTDIATAAIEAAAAVTPGNITDAYADIAKNIGSALKTITPAGVAAVTAMQNQIVVNSGGPAALAPTYIAAMGALVGNGGVNPLAIRNAALAAAAGDNIGAIHTGYNLYLTYSASAYVNYQATLSAAVAAASGTTSDKLAVVYMSGLAVPTDAEGGLAAAIVNSTGLDAQMTSAAISANRSKLASLTIAGAVAGHAKLNLGDIQEYVGAQIVEHPNFVPAITTAATVAVPQFSHVISHAAAFNAPTTVSGSIAGILLHSKIVFAGTLKSEQTPLPGEVWKDAKGAGGRPAAVAAISAGLTTGILESTQLSAAQKKTALTNVITQMTTSMLAASGGFNDTAPAVFRQSDGGVGTFTTTVATGVAGGITGFVAQLVSPTSNVGYVASPLSDLMVALKSAAQVGGSAANDLLIAQAAAQAWGWITVTNSTTAAVFANDVANAVGFWRGTAPVLNAANFGLDEAALGNPGAGANGLRDAGAGRPYYDHHNAQGIPVSNIFTL